MRDKKQRCGECGGLAETVMLGRCPVCTRRITALAADWRQIVVLVRDLHRHDDVRLELEVMPGHAALGDKPDESCRERWIVHGREHGPVGVVYHARIGGYHSMPEAIVDAERFARRWIESAPGTSLATYVARPRG